MRKENAVRDGIKNGGGLSTGELLKGTIVLTLGGNQLELSHMLCKGVGRELEKFAAVRN